MSKCHFWTRKDLWIGHLAWVYFHSNPPQSTTNRPTHILNDHESHSNAMELEHSHSPSLSSTSSSPSPSILSSTDPSHRKSDDASTLGSSLSGLSLAATESRMVLRSKLLVFLVLFVAAVMCGVSAYIFAKESELDVFR
jgi:hypothetical protein